MITRRDRIEKGRAMESMVRAPRTGDVIFVFTKMGSGRLTEISGSIEEVSTDQVHFAVDCIELVHSVDEDGEALERKLWQETETKFLRVCVPLDRVKPFEGTLDKDAPCWIVRT
jgi:hypothetical protein